MTIATEKLKSSVERYTLARVAAKRAIADSSYTSQIANHTFIYSWSLPVAGVSYYGTSFIEETSTPSLSGRYWWDETNSLLYVRDTAIDDGLSLPIVVSHYLFYTSSSEDVQAYETPDDSTTKLRNWQAKIMGVPAVTQSFRNMLDGIVTTSATALQVSNADNALQVYLDDDDSFSKSEIVYWIVYNSSVRKIFTGKISSVSIDTKSATLSIEEPTSALDNTAFNATDAYHPYSSSIYAEDVGKPIPMIFGRNKFGLISRDSGADRYYQHFQYTGLNTYISSSWLNHDTSTHAVCTSYSDTISGTTNRTWKLCRTGSSGFKTLSLGSPTGSVITVLARNDPGVVNDEHMALYNLNEPTSGAYGALTWIANYPSTPDGNLEVGDSFKQTSTGWHYMVTYVGSNFVRGFIQDAGELNATADNYATSDFVMNQAPALVVYDENSRQRYYPFYDKDFTYSISTASGISTMSITFVNNFETATQTSNLIPPDTSWAYHKNMTSVHPSTHIVAFRATQESSSNATRHEKILQSLLESAGLTIDSTTFTAAGAASSNTCHFSIPYAESDEYGNYYSYVQDLLKSTFGYISQTTSGAIKYSLFSAPSSGDTYTNDEILQGSLSVSVDYSNVKSAYTYDNPHIVNRTSASNSSASADAIPYYINGVSSTEGIIHLLNSGSRLAYYLDVISRRRAIYKFSTATYSIESLPGDDITLESDILLGGESSKNLKIISMSISEKQIDIEACDFLGL